MTEMTNASEARWAGRAHPDLGDEAVLVVLHLAGLGALAVWVATWLGG